MNGAVHIFLGANSGEGFCSLYGQLLRGRLDDLLIIKGGPGCGKSSFMGAVAKKLEETGEETIYINCSGDPESLDGVLFPRLKTGLVDGTSPHVLEPDYTAAAERYVDLTRFYDISRAKSLRPEIVAHSDAYRAAYGEAYHILRAADALHEERRAEVLTSAAVKRAERRLEGLARRELRGGSCAAMTAWTPCARGSMSCGTAGVWPRRRWNGWGTRRLPRAAMCWPARIPTDRGS